MDDFSRNNDDVEMCREDGALPGGEKNNGQTC